jgi:hypothetical protein
MSFAALVAHREQAHSGSPAIAQCCRYVGQRISGIEHLRPYQVGRDVEIAEAEPSRLHPVRRQLVANSPGLLGPAPTPFRVDTTPEGVHDAVQIGADSQPVQRDVVAGIHDRYDFVRRTGGTNSPQVARSADAPGQHCDAHVSNLR